ncbi:tRNA 4-thiouridine(8) synthase ThiI [Infirmifilum lucidum]|uniref:tRNA sulfurtransferase n=1 Tax=Infirmifilum lucidum TaxID=2776706 RepID=A0A7L9FH78_9CREN|nr:tRNA uracil 4-sulfurtransferase ThiI [Infirmifilum lucidum]QOJ78294.1 tRNA 4-thiouridine(8) synthase ThiI [Infirmifilum lucidum]
MTLKTVILIRPGELTVKGHRARERFEKLLVRNIKDALSSEGIQAEVKRGFGRFYVYGPPESVNVLRRVFGIRSMSIAAEVEFTSLEDLIAKSEEYFRDIVAGRNFAVRARRAGEHPFTSMDVNRLLGERLLKYARKVDLENPEVEVYVEIRGNRAYFFTGIVEAYGGLPVGSEGRVIALVSGGFDSLVAAWMALKRGSEVEFLYLNLGGAVSKYYVARAVKTLADRWCFGYYPRLFIVDFTDFIRELRAKVRPDLLGVILKRYMYRAASYFARKVDAGGIVTGENLGQVSSQTLANLNVIDKASEFVVLRPVICLDKDEIVKIAREIGTYDVSSTVKEICGIYSIHPRTSASLEEVIQEEEKIDESIFLKAIENAEVLDIRRVKIEEVWDKTYEELDIEQIPPGAVVLDVRPAEKFRLEHIPGSINVDSWYLEEAIAKIGRDKTYIVVCDEGGLSREVAYTLRKMGISAYSLKGGIRAFKRKLSHLQGQDAS